MIGSRVGHYNILEKIGEGGMGVVYRAEDTRLGRTVALKFLSAAAVGTDSNRTRLVNEARTAAGLQHPNICTIYDIGEENDQVFISMAYLPGETLRQRIERSPLTIEDALRIATQIARGLREAHDKDFVHRDIKSANIMLDKHGHAVILDFGLATCATEQTLPMEGTAVGTVAYMSPEQTRGEAVEGRSDLWSLGVCIYEMLTGQLPFKGDYDNAIIYSILNEEPVPPRTLRPEIPEPLEKVVLCLLEKSVRDRCRDAAALLGDLRALSSGAPVPAAERAPSIAVLPFENMSADPEQEYFCAGIAEDILNDLTRVDGLRVAARTTSFAFKGKHEDIREIGRQIGVDTVLEGSVRKALGQLRITAQLIDVESGYHMWSQRWDRDSKDVFAIQDEISRNIVQALKIELTAEEKEELCRPGTGNIDAYDLYLRGRQYLYREFKHVEISRDMFRQAIDIDPDYAQAHAGLALAYGMLSIAEPDPEIITRSLDAARRAIELDPNSAEGHTACAFALSPDNYEEAKKHFEIAMRINPDLYDTYYFYGRAAFANSDHVRAAEMFEKAAEVDPNEYQGSGLASTAYEATGQKERSHIAAGRALERVSRHVALNPDDGRAVCLRSNILAHLGRMEEAMASAERALQISPEDPGTLYNTACVFARAGEKERAITSLKRSADMGWSIKAWADNDPDLDPLREEPAFKALMERMS